MWRVPGSKAKSYPRKVSSRFGTRAASTCGALEIGVHQRDRLVFVPGHEVPVAVERDLDRAVAEVGGEGRR